MTSTTSFPKDWPDDCPPDDAVHAGGDVFRIVSDNPPTEDDLKSYAELGIQARGSQCRRRAISVFESFGKARHRLRMSPRLGTAVARATLSAEHGKQKLTNAQSGHIAWWCADGVDRSSMFNEVTACL